MQMALFHSFQYHLNVSNEILYVKSALFSVNKCWLNLYLGQILWFLILTAVFLFLWPHSLGKTIQLWPCSTKGDIDNMKQRLWLGPNKMYLQKWTGNGAAGGSLRVTVCQTLLCRNECYVCRESSEGWGETSSIDSLYIWFILQALLLREKKN